METISRVHYFLTSTEYAAVEWVKAFHLTLSKRLVSRGVSASIPSREDAVTDQLDNCSDDGDDSVFVNKQVLSHMRVSKPSPPLSLSSSTSPFLTSSLLSQPEVLAQSDHRDNLISNPNPIPRTRSSDKIVNLESNPKEKPKSKSMLRNIGSVLRRITSGGRLSTSQSSPVPQLCESSPDCLSRGIK